MLTSLEGYSVYRRDREGRKAGGVAVYVKDGLNASVCELTSDDRKFELLWVKIQDTARTIFVGAFYHPPTSCLKYTLNDLLVHIESSIATLLDDSPGALVILAGDMNSLVPSLVTEITGLIDIVSDPTRGSSKLDHIFISEELYFDHVRVLKPTGSSDHDSILAYRGQQIQNPTKKTKKFTTFRRKTPTLNAAFLQWASRNGLKNFDPLDDTQTAFDTFYSEIGELLNCFSRNILYP